jgi:hypothetical protein
MTAKPLLAAASAFALLLAGCASTGPDERRRPRPSPSAWSAFSQGFIDLAISGSARPSRSTRAGTNMTASCPTGARPGSPTRERPALDDRRGQAFDPRRLTREQRFAANFALGADEVPAMLRDTEMVDVPLEPSSSGSAAPTSRQPEAAGRGLLALCAGRDDPACMDKMNANKPQGGRSPARGRSSPASSSSSSTTTSSRSRARGSQGRGSAALQPAEFRLHQHPRAVREGPAVGLLYRAARPELAEGEQDGVRPGRRTCCSPRSTRCGRATSSTSSTPTARRTCSAGCSSATPSPRAGRITPRR